MAVQRRCCRTSGENHAPCTDRALDAAVLGDPGRCPGGYQHRDQPALLPATAAHSELSRLLCAHGRCELFLLRWIVLGLRRRQLVREHLVQRAVVARRSVRRAALPPAGSRALLPPRPPVLPQLARGLRPALGRALGQILGRATQRMGPMESQLGTAARAAADVPAAILGQPVSAAVSAGCHPDSELSLPTEGYGGAPALRAAEVAGPIGAAAAGRPAEPTGTAATSASAAGSETAAAGATAADADQSRRNAKADAATATTTAHRAPASAPAPAPAVTSCARTAAGATPAGAAASTRRASAAASARRSLAGASAGKRPRQGREQGPRPRERQGQQGEG